jgi:hypothetical protein
MHLPGHRGALRIRVDRCAEPPAILDDVLRLVLREDAEVQRFE